MIVADNVLETIQKSKASKVKMTAVYDKPVKAPIEQGQKLGIVKIEIPGEETQEVDLVAGTSVNKLNFFGKIMANLKYLLLGEQ